MAKGKKGFMLYADQYEILKQLTDEQAGKLFKHILSYVNDEDPKTDDPFINLAFAPIKTQLKRDLKKWEEKAIVSRENGKKGGRPIKNNNLVKNPENPVGYLETQHNPEEPKKPVNVNVSVNDNVNVTVKKDKTPPTPSWRTDFQIYLSELDEAVRELLQDSEFIAKQQSYNPSLDIPMTIDKAVNNYWGTELAWEEKKKSKTKNINWKMTIANAISHPQNKVYKQTGQQRQYKTQLEIITERNKKLLEKYSNETH